MTEANPQRTLSARVSPETAQAVKAAARALGISVQEWVNRAVDAALEKQRERNR